MKQTIKPAPVTRGGIIAVVLMLIGGVSALLSTAVVRLGGVKNPDAANGKIYLVHIGRGNYPWYLDQAHYITYRIFMFLVFVGILAALIAALHNYLKRKYGPPPLAMGIDAYQQYWETPESAPYKARHSDGDSG